MRIDSKNLLKLIILAFSFALLLAILIMLIIWYPRKEKTISEKALDNEIAELKINKIGVYSDYNYSSTDIAKKYINDASANLFNNIDDILYNLAEPSYLKYYNLDKTSLKELLNKKGIVGQLLNAGNYKSAVINSHNVYYVNLYTVDKSINDYVTITEYLPNDIKLSFDNFISFDDTPKQYAKDEFILTILDKAYFVSKVDFNINLINTSDYDVTINKSKMYQFFYLKLNNSKEYRNNTSTFTGDQLILTPNQQINLKLSFDIPELAVANMDSIVLKDVYITKNNISKDVEFKI